MAFQLFLILTIPGHVGAPAEPSLPKGNFTMMIWLAAATGLMSQAPGNDGVNKNRAKNAKPVTEIGNLKVIREKGGIDGESVESYSDGAVMET